MKVDIVLGVCLLATAFAANLPAIDKNPFDILPVGDFKPEGRIIGGENAEQGRIAYQVGLLLVRPDATTAWCGGSLISAEWVLTAAHCLSEMKEVNVYLGNIKRSKPSENITSSDFRIHSGYVASTHTDDIALVKLPSKATLNANVDIVVLPRISKTYSDYLGETAIVSGWGRTSDDSNLVSEDLLYVFLKIDPNTLCSLYFGSFVTETNICAGTTYGTDKRSPCNGDSGGPLVINDRNRTQIGLVSYGSGSGCAKGYPAVYTRVTSYLQWIKDISGVYTP